MKRRDFIRVAGVGTATGLLSGNIAFSAGLGRKTDLGYHKITDIKFLEIKLAYPRFIGKSARNDSLGNTVTARINILFTDQGASGWGLNRSNEKILNEKFSLLRGKRVEDLLIPEKGAADPEIELFDFSLFDLAGNITRKPVYKLLGKHRPETSFGISRSIYFDDLEPSGIDKMLKNCQLDYENGYRQFKVKIGRGYRWMDKEKGLKSDIEITKLIAENFRDCDIIIDAENSFTSDEFLVFLNSLKNTRLYMIENPFSGSVDDYIKLYSWLRSNNLRPLIAAGEPSPDQNIIRSMGSQRIINVFNHDIVNYGFTRWIALMNIVKIMGIKASPRSEGLAIKTVYSAHLSGALGNTATIENYQCISDDIDLSSYSLKNGKLIFPSEPGFGMKILRKF